MHVVKWPNIMHERDNVQCPTNCKNTVKVKETSIDLYETVRDDFSRIMDSSCAVFMEC